MVRIFIITILLSITSVVYSQGDDPSQKMVTNESEFQKRYKKNIKKTRINGVYIPKDLDEAYEELSALSDEKSIQKFKAAPEKVIARKLHFGLGRWIAVNWNLEEGSRYEHYLREQGLVKVDDMMQFTIVSWHRHLNGRDQQIEERVKHYDEKLKKELEAWKRKSTLIHTEKRKIEQVDE